MNERLQELEALARSKPLELARRLWTTEQELDQTSRQISEKEHELQQYKEQLTEALAYIAQLKRELFGSKSDKLTPEQEGQLNEIAQDLQQQAQRDPPASDGVVEEEQPVATQQQRRRARRPVPAHVEIQEIVLEAPEKICPHTGKEKVRIGQEITTEYDLIPEKLICRRIIRPKYAPCGCSQCRLSIAALPPRLLAQSVLGVGLAVYILLSRYDDHVAFYTLERIFRERHGIIIPRQQMVQWVEQIALWLQAIYNLMWQALLRGGYLQIDETPVKVLDPEIKGKAGRGYLWFYSDPKGDCLLDYRDGRGQDGIKEKLARFCGTIQTDAYEVYNAFRRQLPAIKRIGCLAHARRRFYTAAQEGSQLALWFIAQIRQLYRIEQECRDLPPDQRKTLRRQKAPPLWKAIKKRAQELKASPVFLPRTSLGKAVSYFLNEYTALVGYLRDGRFEIDNNLVEGNIRPTCVGKKRWLFIGHPDAGWRSAVVYSILISCRRRGINPHEYLTDVLNRLPSMKSAEVSQLLPGRWKPPEHRPLRSSTLDAAS